jgi:hypothetical protein
MDKPNPRRSKTSDIINLDDYDLWGEFTKFLERQPSRKESLAVLALVLILGGYAITGLLHVDRLIKEAEARCIHHYEYVKMWEEWERPKLVLNPYSNDSMDRLFRNVLGGNYSQYYPPGPD